MKQVTKDILKRIGYTALYGGLAANVFNIDKIIYENFPSNDLASAIVPISFIVGGMGAYYNATFGPLFDLDSRKASSNLEGKL